MSAEAHVPKRDRVEPLFWLLFGAGGMVNAFGIPAAILVMGLGLGFGLIAPETFSRTRMLALVSPIWIRLLLAAIAAPILFHGAHRLRFALVDVGLKSIAPFLSFVCYGSAALTSAYLIYRLLAWS